MVSPVITEHRHAGGFLVSDANGRRSRDAATLLQQSGILDAGTILGRVTTGSSATATANAGNTGNGTFGTITIGQGAIQGSYSALFSAATVYQVFDPNGELVGEGHTGVAFAHGGLGFTITAGGTPFVDGDGFAIAIAANTNVGDVAPLSLTAADGTQIPCGILWDTVDATGGPRAVAIVDRDAEVNGSELIYPSGATTNQIAAINAQLAGLDIVVR